MAQHTPSLTLTAPSHTDIWRKPPNTNIFNAPHALSSSTPFPLASFRSARVTLRADWREKYDQAGLLFVIEDSDHPVQTSEEGSGVQFEKASWIKAGLEYFNDEAHVSFVGCDRFADWSVHPAHPDGEGKITVEMRREGDENGVALWAYEITTDGRKEVRWPIRECTWLWERENRKTGRIGAYCARPKGGEKSGGLEVTFTELVIDADPTQIKG